MSATFPRTFDFEVTENPSGVFRLERPFDDRPNGGDLELRLISTQGPVSGVLSGGGLAADGVHTFAAWESSSRTGAAQLRGVRLAQGRFEGSFACYVTFSVFRTAGGGQCTATDHSWRLTARD